MSKPELARDRELEPTISEGVMCVLVVREGDDEKFVLTSSPPEDYENITKAEKLASKIEFILLGSGMISFPGGKIEGGEDRVVGILREAREELGIELNQDKLVLRESGQIEIAQLSSGTDVDDPRRGMTTYRVACFVYELSGDELIKIEELMNKQGRSMRVLSIGEVWRLKEFEIRPSSLEAIKALRKTYKTRIAEEYGVKIADLRAVVYRSIFGNLEAWMVFGTKNINRSLSTADNMVYNFKFSDLNEVPQQARVCDASEYGLESGKIILVESRPPLEEID
jgi:8-oxo-dGTP pyrophosphatase MutT (NUDIX family)